MSEIVFRNYNKQEIKNLLKEIGKERYDSALTDHGLSEMKPISMDGFYIEYEVLTQDIYLYHRYPSGVTINLLPVLGYWATPEKGWELFRKE